MSALAAVGEEISAAGCSLLLIVVSPAIVGSILARHGTDEQKERWLPASRAGTTKIAFAITEPDAGSNSHNLSTAARARDGALRPRGTKTSSPGVEDADAILVVARSARAPTATSACRCCCIVDTDAPGLEKQHIPMRCVGPDKQWTLFFDDVEVPAERLIGGPRPAG